jgi:hypothetical protein
VWPYFLLLTLTLIPVFFEKPIEKNVFNKGWIDYYWIFFCIYFIFFIGLRYEVGGDWFSYLDHVDNLYDEGLIDINWTNDPSYALLNWIGANVFGGVFFTNLISAVVFSLGLFHFCKALPRPWLAVVVSIPYLVMVVSMGYTRQGVAIGLAMVGIVALLKKENIWLFVFWIFLAATFHKSAIILIPVALFIGSKRILTRVIATLIGSLLLFFLFVQESIDALIDGYINAGYASSGASIRIAMNALPAILFILLRSRFIMPDRDKIFWTWISISAIFLVLVLWLSPSSTAVDRIALYWIPLQVFLWSSLPDVLGVSGRKNLKWVSLVVSYAISVMMTWLFFADFSFAWVPYKFYPWVWLWS